MTSLTTLLSATAVQPSPAPTDASGGEGLFGGNWLTIAMFALIAVMLFFMWRNSRKRKADQAGLQSKMVPGVDVMTSFGLFGTLVSVDDAANTAELEVSPGNIVKVHRQTLVKVVDPATAVGEGEPRSVEEAMQIAEREQRERDAAEAEQAAERKAKESNEAQPSDDGPRFGERIADDGDEDSAKH